MREPDLGDLGFRIGFGIVLIVIIIIAAASFAVGWWFHA